MHVVLLGIHLEIGKPGRDRVIMADDFDFVRDDAPGMGDPLSPDHKLVFSVAPEGISQPAVPASPTPPFTASINLFSCWGVMVDIV